MKTFLNKEGLTTKLTLVIVGLTAGSGLLIPATYASFHPVTSGEIADNTIRSVDIANGQVLTADIGAEQVRNGDIGAGQVTSDKISDINGVNSEDIVDGEITAADLEDNTIQPNIQIIENRAMIPANSVQAVSADCPSGMLVTGGGYNTNPFITVFGDAPGNDPIDTNSWVVTGHNTRTSADRLIAYAVCIGPMP